ncbi:MAG TPA: hypothetical protein VGK67_00175 [Myxococcales bacterium]|jgi:FMN phosphatase YigB (HAD superfamily)
MNGTKNGDTIDSEKEQLLADFLRHFGHLRQIPIALYGIGANTHYILKRIMDFNIVGLMDPENTGREVYGLPVISKEQAAHSVRCIIIVARAAFVPIIHSRISALASSHGIAIYDLGGNDLSAERSVLPSRRCGDYRNGEAEIRKAIDDADVVSFDVFDTLLTRRVLRHENVFDIVERGASDRLGLRGSFKLNRILAERFAAEKQVAPGIDAIYDELARLLQLSEFQKRELLEEEVAAELRILTPRRKMVALLKYAVAQGKTVSLISDMYFGKEVLSRILQAHGITGHKDLFISCEHGMTKRSGELFRHFLEREPSGVHLHVGDDPVADVEGPRGQGIRTFQVSSGYEMLVQSPFAHLLTSVSSFSDALALGLFVARAFNDPFALHATQGQLALSDPFDLGYLAYGAMLTGFVRWVTERVRARPAAKILFGARDGYLVEKLYSRYVEQLPSESMPQGIYFLTSRRATTVSSIHDRGDITRLLTRVPGNPTYGETLKASCGVEPDPSDPRCARRMDREDTAGLVAFVLEFEQRILENARAEREAYCRYARSLGVGAGEEVYFFDLATSGTIPHFLRHALGLIPHCLCFIVNVPLKQELDIEPQSYLGKASPYQKSWNFLATRYLTESILTAPFPEFTRMGDDGVPVYGRADDSHRHFDRVGLTQDGIEAFFSDFLSLAGRSFGPITVELADELNGILTSPDCIFSEALRASYLLSEDAFSPPLDPWSTIPRTSSTGRTPVAHQGPLP